jgi:hypothetical protein
MMQLHPERLRAFIVQNANTYQEGLGVKWTGIARTLLGDRAGHPEVFDAFVSQAVGLSFSGVRYGVAILHNASIEYFPAPVTYNSNNPPIMLRFL